MGSTKLFFAGLLSTMAVCLLAVAGINYYVDPFYQYHEPWGKTGLTMEYAIYQTPGAARTLTYDSAIVGSSMTENIRASWLRERGYSPIKLSYSGAQSKDLEIILKNVFDSSNEVRLIVMDINDFQLTSLWTNQYQIQPAYLYEKHWYDDTKYLWSDHVLAISIGRLLEAETNHIPDIDLAYTWEDPDFFSEENARRGTKHLMEQEYQAYTAGVRKEYDLQNALDNCNKNLEYFRPYITEHPETQFKIFFPPYSILYWERLGLANKLEYMAEIYQYAMEWFMQFPNVSVYNFQMLEDIHDLDRYHDEGHHDPAMNKTVVDAIFAEENLVTEEFLEQYKTGIIDMSAKSVKENWGIDILEDN